MVNALNAKRSLSKRIVEEACSVRWMQTQLRHREHVVNQIVSLVARLQRNIVAIMQMQMQLK